MSTVVAVSRNEAYAFSKPVREQIILVAGIGVEGDAHAGTTVKHRGRVRADPTQPNLRQVHLLPAELFEEVREEGYDVGPGQLGENVTTRDIDLRRLPPAPSSDSGLRMPMPRRPRKVPGPGRTIPRLRLTIMRRLRTVPPRWPVFSRSRMRPP
jgi:hypothetical protein